MKLITLGLGADAGTFLRMGFGSGAQVQAPPSSGGRWPPLRFRAPERKRKPAQKAIVAEPPREKPPVVPIVRRSAIADVRSATIGVRSGKASTVARAAALVSSAVVLAGGGDATVFARATIDVRSTRASIRANRVQAAARAHADVAVALVAAAYGFVDATGSGVAEVVGQSISVQENSAEALGSASVLARGSRTKVKRGRVEAVGAHAVPVAPEPVVEDDDMEAILLLAT